MKLITLFATLFTLNSNATVHKCQELQLEPNGVLNTVAYRILDGDTINIIQNGNEYSIRMLGIDTPELHFQGKAQPIWGQKAKDVMDTLVHPNDPLTLKMEQLVCDKYGRILAHVFKNGKNINLEMIKKGMAVNYCIAPNVDYCIEYSLAIEPLFYGKKGIFSDPSCVVPYVWRKQQENLPMDKIVMDYRTRQVYSPNDYYKIPLPYRVFYLPIKP